MAVTSPCARLASGQDNSCLTNIDRKYYQQVVLINKSDLIDIVESVPTAENPECVYTVGFSLKDGTTGYRIQGAENGSVFNGYFDKSVSDLFYPQFIHHVDMVLMGVSEQTKCMLDSISRSSVVAAMQVGDTIEIYGIRNGLSLDDFTFNIGEGGGGGLVTLSSLETAPESRLPFVYVSNTPGSEVADFDALFANIAPSV